MTSLGILSKAMAAIRFVSFESVTSMDSIALSLKVALTVISPLLPFPKPV